MKLIRRIAVSCAALMIVAVAESPAQADTTINFATRASFGSATGKLRWHSDAKGFTIPAATLKDGNCSDGKEVFWYVWWNPGWTNEGQGTERSVDNCSSGTWRDIKLSWRTGVNHVRIVVCRDDLGPANECVHTQ
ncbi:hypothetical protein [Streptomyces adonidis]|uniref:hypothetical protein n=1 Tax=Streptomyces adonidis TaxID=3231367 RepID=UPI0034DB65B6